MLNLGRRLACVIVSVLALAGCGVGGSYHNVGAYQSCVPGDYCAGNLYCVGTTLPVSSGYSGSFCTASCNYSEDCPQLVSNYDAICVNSQCYLQCPTGSNSCPYGQGCFSFSSNVGRVNLCTP